MPDQWYIARNKQKCGPYSSDQLKQFASSGNLQPSEMVMKDGTGKWMAASTTFFQPETDSSRNVSPPPPAIPLGAAKPESTAQPSKPVQKGVPPGRRMPTTTAVGPPPLPVAVSASTPGNPWWKKLLEEGREIAAATWGQTCRFVIYAKEGWQGRFTSRAYADAQVALGERINELRSGDRQVQGQIAALDEKICQAEAAKTSTNALKAERKSLVLLLAGSAISQQVPPSGAEAEHKIAREATDGVEKHEQSMKLARSTLTPKSEGGWRRIGIGYGAVGCVFVVAIYLMFGSRRQQPTEPRVAGKAPKSLEALFTQPSENEAKLSKAVAKGDALWDEGVQGLKEADNQNKSTTEAKIKLNDAFEKYMVVVNSRQQLSDRAALSRVYGRVIDMALGRRNNPSLAKEVAIKSLRQEILPSTSSDKASATLASAKQALRAEEKELDKWLEKERKASRGQEESRAKPHPGSNSSGSSGYVPPFPPNKAADEAVQSMRNAGTYTPEAERNIREIYKILNGKGKGKP